MKQKFEALLQFPCKVGDRCIAYWYKAKKKQVWLSRPRSTNESLRTGGYQYRGKGFETAFVTVSELYERSGARCAKVEAYEL